MGNLFSQQNNHNSKDDDDDSKKNQIVLLKNNKIVLLKNKIKNINEIIKKDYLLIQKLTSKKNELLYEIDNNKSYIEELEEFIEYFGLNLDHLSIDAETLGGYFIAEHGVLPKKGTKLKVEDLTIKVSDTDNRRIKSFQVTKS